MIIANTYLFDFSTKDIEKLESLIDVENLLHTLAELCNFSIISAHSKKFNPIGLTSILLLEESHISIHTWPEYNLFCIDIFTCSGEIDTKKVIETIQGFFSSTELLKLSVNERKTSAMDLNSKIELPDSSDSNVDKA